MSKRRFVVCIDNSDHPVSLEIRKIYEVVRDDVAERHAHVRVIDESGDDYLYPCEMFVPIDVPAGLEQALDGER